MIGSIITYYIMRLEVQSHIESLMQINVLEDNSLQLDTSPYSTDFSVIDKETAAIIAIAAWASKYKYDIFQNKIIRTRCISDSIWVVKSQDEVEYHPLQIVGNVYAEIHRDGRILRVKGSK